MISDRIIYSYWPSDDITLTIHRCKRRRPDYSEQEDPFLVMAREKHKLKMKVLKLKEWKLMHQCDKMGIGLPPAHDTDKDNS